MGTLSVRLPDFSETYDANKMRAMVRALEIALGSVHHGRVVPYGAFSDLTDQTAASTTEAYAMTFDTTDYANGVAIIDNSKITVQESGFYNIQFSAQLANPDSSAHDVSIWLQHNGTPLANTNTEITVPSKHGSVAGHVVAAWNFVIYMAAGNYVRLYWQADNTAVYIEHQDVQTSPTRPATPSIILTVTFVSE